MVTSPPVFGAVAKGRTVAPRMKRRPSWMKSVNVNWMAAFAPLKQIDGEYARQFGSIDEAISRPVREGGWQRKHRPSAVLIYNPANPQHTRAIAALESDGRFKAATYLFNCFRVDARSLPRKSRGSSISLRTYSKDGAFVTSTSGTRRLPNAVRTLERAFAKTHPSRLTKSINWLQKTLGTRAYIDHTLIHYERRIICEHCGGCDPVTKETVDGLRQRRRQYTESINRFVATFD